MSTESTNFSLVTAVLPKSTTQVTCESLARELGAAAMISEARGTLLHDQWWKSWVPPISPAKSYLQLLAPDDRVEQVEEVIIKAARLDQQSTGAVFSSPCTDAVIGDDFDVLSSLAAEGVPVDQRRDQEELSAIFCILTHSDAERVSKAAIRAGAHGPVVHYCEGKGLRDRLGWLRITKEHDKEVLVVIAEKEFADDIFDTMSHVARLDLPGRGFMYRLPISKGMYNLPSRTSQHHHEASLQQIIHAIDHLSGHNNWRDQSVYQLPGQGRAVGIGNINKNDYMHQRTCLNLFVERESTQKFSDALLDAGASGLNVHYARQYDPQAQPGSKFANMSLEFAVIRCVVEPSLGDVLADSVRSLTSTQNLGNYGLFQIFTPTVATYVPNKIDYRAA
ncbi:MAG: hypothetical protein AAF434_14530 [Pseudomonadota bacterium]